MRRFGLLLLVLGLFLSGFQVQAEPVNLQIKPGHLLIGPQAFYLDDPLENLEPGQLFSVEKRREFKPLNKPYNNLGIHEAPVWYLARITNPTDQTIDWLLRTGLFDMKTAVYLHRPQDSASQFQTLKPWEYALKYELFDFQLGAHETVDLLVRADAVVWHVEWLELLDERSYWQDTIRDGILAAWYYGALAIMIGYNLLLFLSIRDSVYLWYVATMLTFGFFQFIGIDRFGVVWSEDMNFYSVWSYLSALPVSVAFTVFTQRMLHTKVVCPNWNRLLNFNLFFSIGVLVFGWFLQPESLEYLVTPLGFLLPLLLIGAGIHSHLAGNEAAKYYLTAWGVYLVGLTGFTAGFFGLWFFGLSPWSANWLVKICSAGEIVLLARALGARYNAIKARMIQSQQEMIVLKENQAKMLEAKVIERTKELQEEQERTLDSIRYAKIIQDSYLPERHFDFESFRLEALYSPKDIVSGDFYFVHLEGQTLWMVAADCTGHGVPGAMMTMIGLSSFRRAIVEQHLNDPGAVLNEVSKLVKSGLQKERRITDDGLEGACCKIDLNTGLAQIASARLPIIIWQKGELIKLKGDRVQLGYENSPTNHTYQIYSHKLGLGDRIFITSDGLIDQPGGEQGFGFGFKRLARFLETQHHSDLAQELEQLGSALDQYRADYKRVDDICCLALEFGPQATLA